MKLAATLCGLAALGGTIVPPVLFSLQLIPQGIMQQVMLAAAIVWFAAAPLWMKME